MVYAPLADALAHANMFRFSGMKALVHLDQPPHKESPGNLGSVGLADYTAADLKALEVYWTWAQGHSSQSAFYQALQKNGDAIKHRGRAVWKKMWDKLQRQSKFNSLVDALTAELEIDPCTIARKLGKRTLETGPDTWTRASRPFLAMRLLGPEAFMPNFRDIMVPGIEPLIAIIVSYSWQRQKGKLNRIASHFEEQRDKVDKDWQRLQEGGSKAALLRFLSSVEALRSVALLLDDGETAEETRLRLSRIQELLAEGGKPLTMPAREQSNKRARKNILELLTEEELDAVYRRYTEMFFDTAEAQDPQDADPFLDGGEIADLGAETIGSDLGTEVEMTKGWGDLMDSLSLGRDREVLPWMNGVKNKEAVVVWTEHLNPAEVRAMQAQWNLKREQLGDDDPWEKLTLKIHQLVGICAVLRRMTNGGPKSGVLNSDEVGLGKTAQGLGVICMISHWYEISGKAVVGGMFAAASKKIWGGQEIGNFPHVVIASTTLIENWKSEAKMWLHGFEFFDYGGYPGSRKNFFDDPEGKWMKSKCPHHRRILFATTSAISADAKAFFGTRPPNVSLGTEPGALYQADDTSVKNLLFCHFDHLGVVLVDEAHILRTGNTIYPSMLRIQRLASVVIALTATPIYTHPKDLLYIGRAIGCPWFRTLEADEYEGEIIRAINRARRHETVEAADCTMSLITPDLNDVSSITIREAYVTAVKDLKRHFGDTIIRRTLDSVDNDGNRLSNLPSYMIVNAWVRIQSWETDILTELVTSDKQMKSWMVCLNPKACRSFYLMHRQGVAQPELMRDKVTGKSLTFRPFGCINDFNARASTKTKTVIQIILHHAKNIEQSESPLKWDEETGEVVVPLEIMEDAAAPMDMTQAVPDPPKFVVYTEFTGLMEPLLSAFDLHSIQVFKLDGTLSAAKRERVIADFSRHSGPAVMLMSSVGLAGINLSAAHIMIFMDQVFSEQEKRQLRGRVWRQPQKRRCIIYDIVAMGTADNVLNGIARKKEEMLSVFASKSSYAEELLEALRVSRDGNYTPPGEEDNADQHDFSWEGFESYDTNLDRKQKKGDRKSRRRSVAIQENGTEAQTKSRVKRGKKTHVAATLVDHRAASLSKGPTMDVLETRPSITSEAHPMQKTLDERTLLKESCKPAAAPVNYDTGTASNTSLAAQVSPLSPVLHQLDPKEDLGIGSGDKCAAPKHPEPTSADEVASQAINDDASGELGLSETARVSTERSGEMHRNDFRSPAAIPAPAENSPPMSNPREFNISGSSGLSRAESFLPASGTLHTGTSMHSPGMSPPLSDIPELENDKTFQAPGDSRGSWDRWGDKLGSDEGKRSPRGRHLEHRDQPGPSKRRFPSTSPLRESHRERGQKRARETSGRRALADRWAEDSGDDEFIIRDNPNSQKRARRLVNRNKPTGRT